MTERLSEGVAEVMRALEGARRVATMSDVDAARRDRARARKDREARLAAYGDSLPEEDVERILAGRVDSACYERLKRWLATDLRFFWLIGSPGIGKTVSFGTIVADHGGVVVLGADLVRIYRFDSVANLNQRARIERAPILILDDLGTKDAAAEQDALFTVINKRQGPRCKTLLTGNLTMAQVNDYDARILSRVRGRGVIVEVTGDDYRTAGRPAR